MRKSFYRKGLVIGMMILFAGSCIVLGLNVDFNDISNIEIIDDSIKHGMLFGDPPEEEWNRTYGGSGADKGISVCQTNDLGFIIIGCGQSSPTGKFSVLLIKTDRMGNELWNKSFGGIRSQWGEAVQQTDDGGYIIAGGNRSENNFRDLLLIKTDSVGNETWIKTFGGENDDYSYSVIQTDDDCYITSGTTGSYGNGDNDVWLIKTDSMGNEIWNKTFGGTSYDGGHSCQQTDEGGYIITGLTMSYGNGSIDVWLIKTDSMGNEIWNKTFGGTRADGGYSCQQTDDGGYIIAGFFGPGGSWSDVLLLKTDYNGIEQWNKTFGGDLLDEGNSVKQTIDGGYIIAGTHMVESTEITDVWLIKTDNMGNEVWNETYGNANTSDSGHDVQQTADYGYIIVGDTWFNSDDGRDVWLIKVSSEDNPIADVYVDDDNTVGPWNGTLEHPYQYIQDGVNAASNLDTVFVFNGIYYENVVIDNTINLIGENKNTTIIDGCNISDVIQILHPADYVNITGFTLANTSGYGPSGLYLHHADNCNIFDNIILNNSKGISLFYSDFNNIFNNIVKNTSFGSSIGLSNSKHNNISDNILTDNVAYCLYLGGAGYLGLASNNNICSNNVISHTTRRPDEPPGMVGTGIYCTGSNNLIKNNTIFSNEYGGIEINADEPYGNNNDIIGNILDSNGYFGIRLSKKSTNSNVTENTIFNNGLNVMGSHKNNITNNIVNGKPLIYLEEESNISIEDVGQVVLVNCSNISIQDLDISNADIGIDLWNTDNCIIRNNILSSNSRSSIELHSSNNNNIELNDIKSNKEYGIKLFEDSNNNILSKNNIYDNQWDGVCLVLSCYNNTFFHNNFFNNTYNNAFDNYINIWYNGTIGEGNYWDDYVGEDADSDGIGDIPYNISGGSNQDFYPLMYPWSITTLPVIYDEYPMDLSTDVDRPPTELSATVEDPDDDSMDVYIKWIRHDYYHVGEEVTLQTYMGVGNGTFSFIPSGNDWIWGDTTYTWSISVTDGVAWTNETYTYTTGGSRYDVSNNDLVNFQDAGLVWVHRTSEVPYDGLYDVNGDGQVNFQDAGLTWINRD